MVYGVAGLMHFLYIDLSVYQQLNLITCAYVPNGRRPDLT